MKRKTISTLLMGVYLGAVACSGPSKSTEDQADLTETKGLEEISEETIETTVPEAMMTQEQVRQVVAGYLSIKDALVKSDSVAAGVAASEIVPILDGREELTLKLKVDVEYISDGVDLEAQRSAFYKLSENVYMLVKSTDAMDVPLYRQYCPMARHNEGAYWLSTEKEVLNPYFGDQMLRCGSVKEEI
ncbi:hypothetical protein BFP72_05765 [Reichenbachiella sp. 5M10]|uniref:DUF3347 domain-containing protein n=1 Tax=Reichenbachiella sp. 5M10 TaxID=1889772 RepID=UPI000C15CFB5|nr:DUF3347 domain-containing protein [Reichenbachiella sp. 5M10]PIB34934.1 hypothetical protein BFP72_05765 [Reichenbachiella sp. 5M10]